MDAAYDIEDWESMKDAYGESWVQQQIFIRHTLLLSQNVEPVSYTHLDVYKRQAIISGIKILHAGCLRTGPQYCGIG